MSMYGWPFSEMNPGDAAHEEHLAAQDRADAAADRLDDLVAPAWRTAMARWCQQCADAEIAEIRDLPEAS